MSAGSSTQPGGYMAPDSQLDQFEISDNRPVEQVVEQMKRRGINPVWKDWEMGWVNS